MSFVHLHNHSHYSLLDGLSKIPELVAAAKAQDMPALALTDHGVMYGCVEFFNTCNAEGIKPIIGMEAYVAPGSRLSKSGRADADYYHLTLLAENFTGYKNLMMLSTLAHVEGYYYKPRVDLALLEQYHHGLIALSGCQRGAVARAAVQSIEKGLSVLEQYTKIFGRDNFFLEIQRNSLTAAEESKEKTLNNALIALSEQTGVPLVATQDCHYIAPTDAEAQDIMVCIGTGRKVQDQNRLNMTSHDLSLRSPEHMEKNFSDVPEAIHNTLLIAERCNVTIPINQRYFAEVELPPGMDDVSQLKAEVSLGAQKLYANDAGVIPVDIQERIDYELEVICEKGFAVYFLMVADIVRGAHAMGALTNTRGSAAGSIVGHILGISAIDPLYYQLPFERFLTKSRPTPPDVDLDISDNRRDEAIAWITQRYGHENVAQIITFGTMMARAVVRDVGRALGISYGKCDTIAKMIPQGKQGFQMNLNKALELNPELKAIYEEDDETKTILDIGRRLEGCARHASIHAAALAITPTPLTDYTPLQNEPGGERLITQYDMYSLDVGADGNAIGVVKMDLLGIRNLSILEEAVKLVDRRYSKKINVGTLPLDDAKTYKLLADGHTFGVFQLGSAGMTKHLRDLKPSNIFDIMAMIALYRPGPMGIIPDYIARKHGLQKTEYFDPRMKAYLERSRGLLVYQDDVLLTAIEISGYSWEEADKLRKAMGKKIPEVMAAQKEKFVSGAIKKGMSQQHALELFHLIEPFAAYGFNKSHAASYSMVSYQTAYMKANYTVEFMAAVMTAESGDELKIQAAVRECKSMGITVLPPSVESSYDTFTVIDDHTIRFGLKAIKNLGSDVINKIIECHEQKLSLATLPDFLKHCQSRGLNKRSWEALVKAGALDAYGERGTLLHNTESVLGFVRTLSLEQQTGQFSLFQSQSKHAALHLEPGPAVSEKQKLLWEKEFLGMFVSDDPLRFYAKAILQNAPIQEIYTSQSEAKFTIAGIISGFKKTITKKNELMAFFTLQDGSGNCEVLVFPKIMTVVGDILKNDAVVQVKGKVFTREGETKITADEITVLPDDTEYTSLVENLESEKGVCIMFSPQSTQQTLHEVKAILEQNPGKATVFVEFEGQTESKRIRTKTAVRLSPQLRRSIEAVPGVIGFKLESID